MKRSQLFRLFLGGTLVLLLNSCASFSKSRPDVLVGTWTNSLGTVWIIHEDGMFDVDLDKDGKRDGWGKWTATSDTVTFVRKGGLKPKGCEGKGVYRFTRTNDGLQFTLVSDNCKLRVKHVTLPWKRKL